MLSCYFAIVTANKLIDPGTDIAFIALANMLSSNKICFVLNSRNCQH